MRHIAAIAALLTVTGGAAGTGNGTVTYEVAPGTLLRTGTLTIGGHAFPVTQPAATESAITQHPSNQLILGGLNAQFAVAASGVPTPTYQWQASSVNGYTVYFSDRRGNKNAAGLETGEYGAEDFVNPPWNGNGTANGALDAGEDVNENGVLDSSGQTPSYLGAVNTSFPPAPETGLPFTNAARPWTNLADVTQPAAWPNEPNAGNANRPTAAELAQANRAILFRRALKLTHGSLGNLVAPGLTVVAENPIYVQGNWNADGSAAPDFPAGGVAASIIADAITILSNNWNDVNSFTTPDNHANRVASATWYRFAALAGTPVPFSYGGGAEESFGADGGVHNFLRMLENWNGQTVNYLGAMATFYCNRQATGIFKFGNNVYRSPSTRNLTFDVNILDPALLPPLTPMVR